MAPSFPFGRRFRFLLALLFVQQGNLLGGIVPKSLLEIFGPKFIGQLLPCKIRVLSTRFLHSKGV
jgi:hypothetical protein